MLSTMDSKPLTLNEDHLCSSSLSTTHINVVFKLETAESQVHHISVFNQMCRSPRKWL